MFRETTAQDRVLTPQSWWRRHTLLIAASLCITLCGGWVTARIVQLSGVNNSVSAEQALIATVERGDFVRDIAADGRIVATVRPTLYAPATGTVVLKAHAGDKVTMGQLLAVQTSPELMAKLRQEQATLQTLQADVGQARLEAEQRSMQAAVAVRQAEVDFMAAEREVKRSRRAYASGSYSELQMLRAQDVQEKAAFVLEQARQALLAVPKQNQFETQRKLAELERQQSLLSDLQRQVDALSISSPVHGIVGQVQIADRANVERDAPLMSVLDLNALEVEISMPEGSARDLTTGVAASISGGGRQWRGSVSSVSPEVTNGQVVARVRFDEQIPSTLRQNQRMSVRILLEERSNVLQVDRGSFVDQDGGGFAYVLRDSVAEKRTIRLGALSINKVEILTGLKEGDRVVVSGTETFKGADRIALRD